MCPFSKISKSGKSLPPFCLSYKLISFHPEKILTLFSFLTFFKQNYEKFAFVREEGFFKVLMVSALAPCKCATVCIFFELAHLQMWWLIDSNTPYSKSLRTYRPLCKPVKLWGSERKLPEATCFIIIIYVKYFKCICS